ncbi:MAG: SIR2 family protein [Synechococcus sp.]
MPKIDFAIVTAIDIERDAVCKEFEMGDSERVPEGPRTYWRKALEIGKGEFYEIVVCQAADMGGVDSALLVADTIHHWDPRAILLVGIAAGVDKDEQKFGDLVIGRTIYYYERNKLTAENRYPEPVMYPADATLLDRARNVSHLDRERNVTHWPPPPDLPRPDGTQTFPQIHCGVIASGEKVIADSAIRDEIAEGNRKILAIEMEGYGSSAGAWQSFKRKRYLTIKSICDFADAEKNDEWHDYAAKIAASFTKHFLRDRPLDPRNPPRRPVLSANQYKAIVKQFKFGNVVPFLGLGISPDFYINLASNLIEKTRSEGLAEEAISLDSPNWNIFQRQMGVPCQFCHYPPENRPEGCPLLEGIERDPECPRYKEQQLSVAKINLRYLSQYYKQNQSLRDFYQIIDEQFERNGLSSPNQIHQFFAKLPRVMLSKHYPKRHEGLPFQLIVTTCFDTLLEEAFDEEDQPYDVIYYMADGSERGKFKHKPYGTTDPKTIIDPNNDDAKLPLRKPWGSSKKPHPIILKLYGSQDKVSEDEGFVVTEEHLNSLIRTQIKKLPPSLRRILQESSILFLGVNPNDSELQLLLHWIWEEDQLETGSKLIYPSQDEDIESIIWGGKRKIELLSISGSTKRFVASLMQAVEEIE